MSDLRSWRPLKIMILVLALASIALSSPAFAQRLRIIPIPPGAKPEWTPVPEVPEVYYAPNLPTDVFRAHGKYYLYWDGYLYQAKKIKGPYNQVKQVPPFFYQIDPSLFKTYKPGTAGPAPGGQAPGAPAPGETLTPPPGTPTPIPPAPAEPEKPTGPEPPKPGGPKAM